MPKTADVFERFPSLRKLLLMPAVRRVPVVQQFAVADCGAAALAMVLGYFGKQVPLDELRKGMGASRAGLTAATILRTGRSYGLRGRGVRLEVEDLDKLPPAAILYWEFSHYVVFEKSGRNKVYVVDPAIGRRCITLDAFRRAFTGVALVFEPADGFQPGEPRRRRITGLFAQILECRDLLLRIVSTSILVQILSLAMPLFTGVMIDRVVPRKDYSMLLVLTVGFCVFQLFGVVTGFVRAHLFIHLQTHLEARFTLRFLSHLIDLPYSYFQQHTSGDLMVRLGSNNTIRSVLSSAALTAVMDGTMATFYLALLVIASVPLTAAVAVLAGARVALLLLMRWRQRQLMAESLENQSRSQTAEVEMLTAMELLKAMGLEHQAAQRWSDVFVDGLNISIRRGRQDAVFNGALTLLGAVSTLVLNFYGMYLVLQGDLTLGTMMAFSALAAGFLGPLGNLVTAALQFQMVEVYLERLNEVMDTPVEQDTETAPAAELRGAIAFEHVSFRYSPQEPLVLDDVSFEIAPGARVALVGRTGSGKSTLAKLAAGLYAPASGRILFDGQDLRSFDLRSVRSQLGIVTQETQLFGGSIRRNIALADPQMGLEAVVRAAKAACIHEDICALLLGYETPLADRGLSMSGGQRQRLALARALAASPKVLVLDEATSNLDSVTEQEVNRNLARLKCTRIVVAHRLSTIREADLIVVLDSGKIVERGTHGELLDAGGEYAALVRAQCESDAPVHSSQMGGA